jgi:hypothetical protein
VSAPPRSALEALGIAGDPEPLIGSRLDEWSTGRDRPQMLLRAAIYRLATRIRNEVPGSVPVGTDGHVAQKARLFALIEGRL